MDLGGNGGERVAGADSSVVDLGLWGKSRGLPKPYPLVCHLLDTGAMVEVLWREVLPESVRSSIAAGLGCPVPDAGRLLAFWAALHDIGKVSPGFQAQDEKAFAGLAGYSLVGARTGFGHDLASQRFLHRVLGELGYARGLSGGASGARVAQLLGGHHGCFHLVKAEYGDPRLPCPELGGPEWERARRAMLAAVEAVFGPPTAPASVGLPAGAVASGVVILADWLVSQEDFLRARLDEVSTCSSPVDLGALRAHRARSAERAVSLVREAGLGRLALRGGTFAEEFPRYLPNALQRSVAEGLPPLLSGPGLLLVMAPMGMGKTETALHAARLMGDAAGTAGLLVTLPTMATSDQMYGRVQAYVQRRTDPTGTTAVTLLHSMAWLNSAYTAEPVDNGPVLTGEVTAEGLDQQARTAATAWLRGAKRGLLAPGAVATVDQALLTVLPVRHNVLRMLGLAGKVLVVDEVHAYDAYMQYLLARLLTWLGALRVPVVLLSATVPGSVAERLVRAYLLGARGRRIKDPVQVAYPGWVYADATSGVVTTRTFDAEPASIAVNLVDVPLTGAARGSDPNDGEKPLSDGVDRRAALRTLLAPILREGGCAMVVCTTVAEAQQTYVAIQTWCRREADPEKAPVLTLLHARIPAREREERTALVTSAFGRDVENRPRSAILVATQVAEQSLDLDLDLVVSDLAPVAQLLQRAGRCHRHPQVDKAGLRPDWASGGARLAVLVPRLDGEFTLPKRWVWIYNRSLLRRTFELLARRHPAPVEMPGDVQPMMEEVYRESFSVDPPDDDVARVMEDEAARGIAAIAAIKPPKQLLDFERLTKKEIDEDEISTRLGAPSVRVVCCYVDADGTRWLDPACTTRLPEKGTGPKRRFTPEQVRAILSESIPLRDGPWRHRDRDITTPPAAWADNPTLRGLLLLPHPLDPDSTPQSVTVGDRVLFLSSELGLLG